MTDLTKLQQVIKTFMSDNLHVILEDEGDQSEVPIDKFSEDLAVVIASSLPDKNINA